MRGVCFVCVSGLAHSESELCRAPFRHYFTSLVGTGRAWSPGPPCARACVGTGAAEGGFLDNRVVGGGLGAWVGGVNT